MRGLPQRQLDIAPGVESRSLGDVVLLRAPDGRGHVSVSPQEAAALIGEGPSVEIDADLLRHLHDHGLLVDSPAPLRRRMVVTSAGLELDCLARPVAAVAGPVTRLWKSKTLRALLGVLALVGAVATVATALSPAPQTSPRAAALVVGCLTLVTALFHEFGHAVVIAANGRRVGRLGVGLYFGAPSIYVDSTDAHFLPRGARIAQATAGVFGEMVLAGPVIAFALLLERSIPGIARSFALLTITHALVNLTPLLKLDGYWALTDLLDRPRLAEDTQAALKDAFHRRPADRGLVLYGITCATFGAVLVVVSLLTWWSLRGPILSGLWQGSLLDHAIAVVLALPLIVGILGGLTAVIFRWTGRASNRTSISD